MFVPPHIDPMTPRLPRPEKGGEKSASSGAGTSTASSMPTERQTVNGVEVIYPGNALPLNYPNMPHARIYNPKQAPSAISSENFLAARAGLNPGFMHNAAQTNIERVSNLYKDMPQFENQLDILL